MERTGIAGIFAASLELTREGIVSISQNKSFDKFSDKKGIKSFNLAPMAIPWFSTKSNLKYPQSIIAGVPYKFNGKFNFI